MAESFEVTVTCTATFSITINPEDLGDMSITDYVENYTHELEFLGVEMVDEVVVE